MYKNKNKSFFRVNLSKYCPQQAPENKVLQHVGLLQTKLDMMLMCKLLKKFLTSGYVQIKTKFSLNAQIKLL